LFEDTFCKLQEKNKEIKMIGIWGKDGLELERKYFSTAVELNLELAGAEMADIVTKLDSLKFSLEKYFIKLHFHGYSLIIFSVTSEYFLMLITDPSIIPGKLNFYFDLYKHELTAAL
jgi:predicted regulator of Ras-like GTPase activity (Roadblock/LC7/MglB family)